MAGLQNPWFRLWVEMPNDPKWRTIARVSKQNIPSVIAVYLHVLANASGAEARGSLQNLSSEDIASSLDLDTEQVDAILAAMQGRVLEGDKVGGWEKRQPSRERDDDKSGERVKALRASRRVVTPNTAIVQPCNATVTPCNAKNNLEKRREEKNREEEGESARAINAVAVQTPSADASPPPFLPEYREFIKTERPDLDAARTWLNFCEHYAPEKQSASNWRKWVRREIRGVPAGGDSVAAGVADPDSKSSIEALGLAVGMGRWDQLVEPWAAYKNRVKNVALEVEK
jgi:hypothetical protein